MKPLGQYGAGSLTRSPIFMGISTNPSDPGCFQPTNSADPGHSCYIRLLTRFMSDLVMNMKSIRPLEHEFTPTI